ncbi:MAG: hypothetical protein R3F34_15960 [Planctomycetota bacterium]
MPIDFRLRDHLHPVAVLRLRRTLERTQWMTRDELRAYQAQRLRSVLGHAARTVPHWRATFASVGLDPRRIEDPSELAVLDVLAKERVRELGDALHAEDARRLGAREESTSGSEGRPTRFLLDRRSRVLEFCHYWRHWSWAGYRLGDAFAELGDHHFARRGPHGPRGSSGSARRAASWCTPRACARTASRHCCASSSAACDSSRACPSALAQLADSVADAGEARHRFDAVFSTGELLVPSVRARIERVLGGPVLDSYGHMERTVAVVECERGGRHAAQDYGLLETIDVRAEPGGTRVGRVVGTGLHGLAMPLVRYDVGDEIELAPEGANCPCGRTLPLVGAVRGRVADVVRTPDGRAVGTLYTLVEERHGVRAFQFRQLAPDRVLLLVVPGPRFADAAAEELRAAGHRRLGDGVRLDVVRATEDDLERGPTGKVRPVVGLTPSSVDATAGAGAARATPAGT